MHRTFVCLACLATLTPTVALAQDQATLDAVMGHDQRAGELFGTGQYEDALRELQAAQALIPATERLFNVGVCQDRLGLTEEALATYQTILAADDARLELRRYAEQRVGEIETERVESAQREREAAERAARAQAEREATQALLQAQAEQLTLEAQARAEAARLAAEGQQEPQGLARLPPAAFYATVGFAAAAAITLIGLGAFTLTEHADFEEWVGDQERPADENVLNRAGELSDGGLAYAHAADAFIGITAAAAVAAGIIAIFTNWGGTREGSATRPSASISPGNFSASLSF